MGSRTCAPWPPVSRSVGPRQRRVALGGGPVPSLPAGLPLVGRTGAHDAPDGGNEQGGEGHVGADEGGGEDGGHDVEGGRGGMGQGGEEGGDGAGERREHEGSKAERPDVGTGLSVGHVSLPGSSVPFAASRRPCVPWRRGASPTVSQIGTCQEAAGVSSASQWRRAGSRRRLGLVKK